MFETIAQIDWILLLRFSAPIMCVLASVLLTLIAEATRDENEIALPVIIAGLGLVSSFAFAWRLWPDASGTNVIMLSFDRISFVGIMMITLCSAIVMAISIIGGKTRKAYFFSLILIATLGADILATASDLISILMGMQILYLPVSILNSNSDDREIPKTFIMSLVATSFFIFGTAFIFGSAGSTDLWVLASRAGDIVGGEGQKLFLFGIAGIFIAFSFWVGIVPFHAWMSDDVKNSPTPIAVFSMTAFKLAVFISLIRFVTSVAISGGIFWHHLVFALAIISILWGSLAAMREENLKKIMAYTATAEAGLMFVVFPSMAVNLRISLSAIIFYLISITIMRLAAFTAIAALEVHSKREIDIGRLQGLSKKKPFLAASLFIIFLSLAGLPPTLGFFGRYYLFFAAVRNGDLLLVVISTILSIFLAVAYLRPVVLMYFAGAREEEEFVVSPVAVAVLAIAVMVILTFGLIPQNLLAFVDGSVF